MNLRRDTLSFLETPYVFHSSMALMLLLCIPFIFALLQLLCIQIGNFRAGMTTNERFGRQVYKTNMHAQAVSGNRTPFQNSVLNGANNLEPLANNYYGEIRGETQGSHAPNFNRNGTIGANSNSTIGAQEKFR